MSKKRRISRRTILWQKICEAWLYRVGYRLMPARQRRYIEGLRGRQEIRVAFVVQNVPMWKYQELHRVLCADRRFRVSVVLSPSMTFTDEQRLSDIRTMRRYFDAQGVEYVDWDLEHGARPVDIRKAIDPDIVFYTQPYHGVFHPRHQFLNFTDRLMAYYPYGFLQTQDRYLFDQVFTNVAWKLYYANRYNLEDARLFMRNGGRNVVVVGYPNSDIYVKKSTADVWKDTGRQRKRLIWAPHFTLANDGSAMSRSNFLDICDFMVEAAKRYADRLQIAFKPHPGLLTELYKHPVWGKEKADGYYAEWAQMENTQLETGDYVELFKGSDAMIHDCGSFVIDYLYFNKPVMYLTRDFEGTRRYGNELCRGAYDVHYIGCGERDITAFIEDVVLSGKDTLSEKRTVFYKQNLSTPDSGSVAQNTYRDMLRSLGMDIPATGA